MGYSTKNPPACTHLGQLKLLLSEVEFLTPFYGQACRVIYAGAAPGVHVPIVAGLFPTMRFVLVDPAPSMIADGEYAGIEVIQARMTDAMALELASSEGGEGVLLFISDVRVGAEEADETDEEQQRRIQRDMDAQRRWMELLRPAASMLKFRLPWSTCSAGTEYPSGRIHFPVYGKQLTHESRLIISRDAPPVEYNNLLYERQMAYFNRVMRPAIQPDILGGGRCYDCTAFRWIVCGFLVAANALYSVAAVDDMCHRIERELARLKRQWLARKAVYKL